MKKGILKTNFIAILCYFSVNVTASEALNAGIEGGLGLSALGSEELAQELANKATFTVFTYNKKHVTPFIRFYGAYKLSDNLDLEAGYMKATALNNNTTTSTFNSDVSGFDFGIKFKHNNQLFLKAGIHRLKVESDLSVTTFLGKTIVDKTYEGSGSYVGGGLLLHNDLYLGYTHLFNIGGDSDLNADFFYTGIRFF